MSIVVDFIKFIILVFNFEIERWFEELISLGCVFIGLSFFYISVNLISLKGGVLCCM